MNLKIVIIGLGHIGKLHYELLKKNNFISQIYLIDSDYECTFHEKIYKNIAEFKADNIIADLTVIATPNGLHIQHALEALSFSKNLLIEKPIALNTESLHSLLKEAKIQNKRIFNALQLRFSPVVKWIKSLIVEKKLGDIYMVNVNCYWNRNKDYYSSKDWRGKNDLDGGVLFTQFSHFIDILHYFFGKIELKSANSNNFKHKDSTEFDDTGIFTFQQNTILGSMSYTTVTYPKNYNSNFTIIAEKGTLTIEGQYLNHLKYAIIENTEIPIFEGDNHDFHTELYNTILEGIVKEKPTIVDAKHAIDMIAFLEKI